MGPSVWRQRSERGVAPPVTSRPTCSLADTYWPAFKASVAGNNDELLGAALSKEDGDGALLDALIRAKNNNDTCSS